MSQYRIGVQVGKVGFGEKRTLLEGDDNLVTAFGQVPYDGQVDDDLAGLIRQPQDLATLIFIVGDMISGDRQKRQ